MKKLVLSLLLTASAVSVSAQESKSLVSKIETGILGTVVYSFLGLGIMLSAFKIIDAFLPGKLSEQLIEDRNTPLAVVLAAMIIGIAIIISAAIRG